MPAKVRAWVRDTEARFEKARDALVADGKVKRVGTVNVLRVYDRPVSRPREIDPTNLSVETVLEAILPE